MRKLNNGTTNPNYSKDHIPNLLEARHNHRLVCVMVWHISKHECTIFQVVFLRTILPSPSLYEIQM